MGNHIVNGKFQSDKYPTCPAGKVPLSVKDTSAQDLLWEYAQRRRAVDSEFAADLETCLRAAGYQPAPEITQRIPAATVNHLRALSKVQAPSPFIAWPDVQPRQYNGSGTPCDMWTGPCQCGAWHNEGK